MYFNSAIDITPPYYALLFSKVVLWIKEYLYKFISFIFITPPLFIAVLFKNLESLIYNYTLLFYIIFIAGPNSAILLDIYELNKVKD